MSLAVQRVWVDLPRWASVRGHMALQLSWAARHESESDGSEQRPLGATRGEMYANARSVLDHPRADLDQALPYGCELGLGQRAGLRDGGADAMHQQERRGVEDEPHLIGGRAVARHAVRGELRLVQFDQVLHLPALAIDVLVEMLCGALERGDDITDVNLLAHAGGGALSAVRLQRTLQPRSDAGHDFALRQMPVAHQPLAAVIGELVGMVAEQGGN